ncbi:hypothetical protein RugamoR57_07570 [Duganella caerulea]|uniref:GNAT family N-acetyltransferase n=1 Tax=Duganella caerulea TaxID=2885762 RepID=UPI0030E7D04F
MPDSSAPIAPPPPPAGLRQCSWRGQVPAWVGPALERLYGNLFATLAQFRFSRDLAQAHTYATFEGSELRTLLVFSLHRGVAQVFNEVVCLDSAEIEAFADYVFTHFRGARVVSLRAVHVARGHWRHPRQQYDYLEDTWIALPATVAAYTDSLGKNTRRNLRRYQQSLRDEAPGFQFTVAERGAASPAGIDAIIALNHARMAGKNKRSALDARQGAQLRQLAAACGLVGTITIDGRVCAGAISYRVGDNYFLMVLAHDPEYNRHSLGFLCCYLTICACIERGGKEFHFLWGRYDYKRHFLGQQRALDQLLLYRTPLTVLRHPGLALRTWGAALRRRALLRLQLAARSDHPAARAALRCLAAWRRLRGRA